MKEPTENRSTTTPPSEAATADAALSENVKSSSASELPVPSALTPEQLEELKAKAAKADEHWARLLREAADFENYKKRATRERQDAIRYANENLLQKLIPIIDNFDMAMAATTGDGGSADSIQKGVKMIHAQFKAALTEAGLEEIEASHKPFDPNFHEAVSQKETSEVPEGQVVQQIRKGYKYRDRLIRPATVVVAKKP